MADTPPRLVGTVDDLAAALGVSKSTLYRHLNGNEIALDDGVTVRVLRIGNRVRVPVAELRRVLGDPSAEFSKPLVETTTEAL